ncbi:MAG: hypothetical protein PHY64_05945 [Eubacteriales bacterium]|nr:hypothetical protein [Eubacteriales bacterium]
MGLLIFATGVWNAALAEDGYRYGAWLAYWVYDGSMAELDSLTGKLEKAIAFACIFDAADQPLMLPDTEILLASMQEDCSDSDTKIYLSIVNDIEVSPGSYDNKNSDLLRRLFADDDAMAAHLKALETLIDDYKLTGLELDYENLRDDTDLWGKYAAFIQLAWEMCLGKGVALRVVLPWNAPRYASLPEGPEYSVMCYNLYGYNGTPGPKADIEFLQTICALYQPLMLNVRMAFATGGFDWNDGRVTAVTQEEAELNLEAAGVTPQRDSCSGALNATYQQDNVTHDVWYADAETLSIWRDTCAENGFAAFDIFRLGGNNLPDWESAFLEKRSQGRASQ